MTEKAAIIKDGKVVNVVISDSEYALSMGWIPSDTAKIGDDYKDGSIAPPVKTITLAQRKQQLAALRYQKECAGITVNGQEIVTDRVSQAMLTGAFIACQINPDREIDWKSSNGWAKLSAAHISAIASAVSDHVQACFTREKELSGALDLDIDTDITTGW